MIKNPRRTGLGREKIYLEEEARKTIHILTRSERKGEDEIMGAVELITPLSPRESVLSLCTDLELIKQ